MKPVIIIPALNPDARLIKLVESLKKTGLPIVVINDGSKKECNTVFEQIMTKLQCDVCTHKLNQGKGAAIKTGIRYVYSTYPDSCGCVTADADGQHAAEDILKVAEALEKNPDSLILGIRNFNEENVPFKSKWGNRITSAVFLMSVGKRCPDTQTGLRGIPRQFTEMCLSVPGDRFEYEMNMLLEFAKYKVSFIELPIATIYLENNKSSHFNPINDSLRIYANILKYSLSSLASAAIDILAFYVLITQIFSETPTGILAATTVARCISGCVNFIINKHWVFKSHRRQGIEIFKYLTLFLSQMMLSWSSVAILSNVWGYVTFTKILVDTMLFFASYNVQKRHIFNKKRKDAINNEKVFIKTV